MGKSESTVSHRRRFPVAARRPSVVLCVCARATARLSRGPKPVCLAHPFTCVRLGVVPGLSAPSRRRSRQFPSISIFCPFSPFRPPSLLPVPHPLIRRRQTRYRAPFVLAHRPLLLLFALGTLAPIFSLFSSQLCALLPFWHDRRELPILALRSRWCHAVVPAVSS